MTEKKRPLGITILAVLAGIGAIVSFYHALQFLGLFPVISLGEHNFFGINLVGALFAGLLGVIYIWATLSLWNLRPEGWLFVVALAVISLIFAVISIIGQSTLQAMLPAIVVYGVILLYCLRPGVKDAFVPVTAETAPEPTSPPEEDTAPAADEPTPASEGTGAMAPTAAAAAAVEAEDEPKMPPPPEAKETPDAPSADTSAPVPEVETAPPPPAPAIKKLRVDEIEGIGPTYAATLAEAGIKTTAELLDAGATPSGRSNLAKQTGLSSINLLKWINMADLMRVPGIGEEYSQLLEVAGVDTVKELRTRNPTNLHKSLEAANEEKHLVRRAPHRNEVEGWVEAAKGLEPKISY